MKQFNTLILSVLCVSFSNLIPAQNKSTNISINIGSSVPFGDYAYLKFDPTLYNKGAYPFVGGGANSGINLGFSTTYYFKKNLGLEVNYQFIKNNMILNQRITQIEKNLGNIIYSSKIDNWTANNTFLSSVGTLPLSKENFFLDFKAGVGISVSSLAIHSELFQTNYGTVDIYDYSSEAYFTLATKFEIGLRYYFNKFGIGGYFSSITGYTENKDFVSVNGFSYQNNSTSYISQQKLGFSMDTFNFGLNINYILYK